ncbi:phage portal protein [uncultured Roseibium sp.]|uniref:phage portal protein n=1 Tax=uncultured Roseibium sp. TaxID=1936171 RepID=UPI00262C227E|nr:phage portal protein [uncultured Roseibium sp.]
MSFFARIFGQKTAKPSGGVARPNRAQARYLRDSNSGILASRMAPLTENRDEVRRSWQRAAALALDIIQNSGQLKGACDQIIADTVGSELLLNPEPKLDRLGYDEKERNELIKLIKDEYRLYSWNALECDLRGKFTMPQQVDIGIRYYLAFGEITGFNDWMPAAERKKRGLIFGTKSCLVPPTRLVQDTNETENLFQGVYHDELGRPTAYLFEEKVGSFSKKVKHPAFDASGRRSVLHIFDPSCATDVRGISVLAPAIRTHLQRETLVDATLQMNILQTLISIVLTSDKPSLEAFEAIEQLKNAGAESSKDFMDAFTGYMLGSLEKSAEAEIQLGVDPQVSHLGPGEKLDIKKADMPGQQFLPFNATLARDMARALNTTYGGLTMDYTDATYASTRMETSSVWPGVTRRRERIAAPLPQSNYESWLDECIATGRIPFKGGFAAFTANRDRVCWTNWQGPAKPTADDYKSSRASSERLNNRTSSVAKETADMGLDRDEVMRQQEEEHNWYVERGMRSPYESPATNLRDIAEEEPEKEAASS